MKSEFLDCNYPLLDEIVAAQTSKLVLKLKLCRKMQAMSLADLAEGTGLSKTYLSAFENGRNNPTLKTLLTVVAALEVTLEVKD